MGLEIESRPSDSPHIERVWRSSSSEVDQMMSIATAHWDLVFWQHCGQVRVAVQGPESKASQAPVPEDATFFGISFSLGTSLSYLPVSRLVDGSAELPDATRRSFSLNGSSWHLPDYDNAEAFVRRLAREDVPTWTRSSRPRSWEHPRRYPSAPCSGASWRRPGSPARPSGRSTARGRRQSCSSRA